MDIYANNYNPKATDGDGSCDYDLDNDGVNDAEELLGCTDSNAINFNSLATDNHGMCIYELDDGVNGPDEVPGCSDSNAINYDSLATYDDGSCNYEEVIEPKETLSGFSALMATSMLFLALIVRRDVSNSKNK